MPGLGSSFKPEFLLNCQKSLSLWSMKKILIFLLTFSLIQITSCFAQWNQVGQIYLQDFFPPVVINNKLYEIGNLNNNNITNQICTWDGKAWDTINSQFAKWGGQPLPGVFALNSIQGKLYLLASTQYFNGQHSNPLIEFWDGVSWQWVSKDTIDNGIALCMIPYKNELYVGGTFQKIGNLKSKGLIKWNGKAWIDASSGLRQFTNSSNLKTFGLNKMIIFKDTLFGLAFDYSNSIVNYIPFKFNGINWTEIKINNFNGYITTLGVYNNNLYFSGQEKALTYTLLKYNGNNISTFKEFRTDSLFGTVRSMQEYDGKLYLGGRFAAIDGVIGNCIAGWDGKNWSSLDSGFAFYTKNYIAGVSGIINILPYKNFLYVFGDILSVGKNWKTGGILRWGAMNGINEPDEDIETNPFSLYPNPTSTILNIHYPNSEPAIATILDITGKTISINNTNGSQSQINVSMLPPGIYVLKFQTRESISVQKFIKE
jgi:hypothetical protein